MGRLRTELVAAEGKARAEVEAVSQKASELEETVAAQVSESHGLVARAVEAENKAETAEWDLRKSRETHTAEQAELRAEHERELSALRQQLFEARENCSAKEEELRHTRRQLEKVQEGASADQLTSDVPQASLEAQEGDDFRLESPDQSKGSLEAEALRERVDYLEQRCRILQQQLNQRPIVFQKPLTPRKMEAGGFSGGQALSWEPSLRSMAGPYTAAFVVRLYTASDRALRNFTQKLLKNDAWLWIFYVHLVVLYTIVASSVVQVRQKSAEGPAVSLVASDHR